MTKTRAKARGEAGGDKSSGAGLPQDNTGSDFLAVSIPDELDHRHLAEILPEIPDLHTVSPDVVVFLYELVAKQYALLDSSQRDLDELKAENERKDVEIEQAFLEKESLSKDLDVTIASIQGEATQLKQERDKLAEENAALKAKISQLSESQSSSSTEAGALKHQLEETEREKRELLGVISRSKQDETQREEEVQTLRASLKEARQDHQQLESQIRELRSIETSTKFKLDSLTQQLHLAQSEAERSNSELTTKSEEYARYRRTKHAEMLTLQSSYDTLSQEHTSVQSSFKALQSAHSAQTNQVTQSLSKIQALTSQIAEQEAKYASEANGLKRLVQMMEDREKQAKEIVENIESQWASVGEKAERRENSLKEQLEHEARRREQAEKRVDQLESVLQRIGRGELPLPGTPVRAPGTPGLVMDIDGGMLGLSPTVALASKSQRSGKTFTEVYTDYVRLQEDYTKKCIEHEQMERTLTTVLAEIEERAPLLSQQRMEYERVTMEASELSAQLAQTLSDRDSQAKLAQLQSQKLKKSTAEIGLLQQQLSDLGRQVQTLLREIARRDDPTIPSDAELEDVPFVPANDVNAIITNNLVLFRSIDGLQQQNQKLLRITRELGEKMETEERDYKAAMEQEQAEAIREAHEAMQELASQLEMQKRNSDGIIQSYVKERDALKSMLTRAEAAAARAGVTFTNGRVRTESHVAVMSDSEIAKELAEVQEQFETYKTEMGVDSSRLREDLTSAQREVHELSSNLAKANAKIEYLNERHRVHSEQFKLTHRELDDMTKRSQSLFDQWTRADIECNRLSEDLHVSNGRLEQLRNECANLRAEKQIWEGVQARLMDENKTLSMERSHLSDLMSNIQKMHNDLERSGESDRRRLENQLQLLEGQTQDLRTQLSRERDSLRHTALQKDLESKELQTRLDKANLELSKTRESLIGAETSKQHLEQRADDLSRHIQGIQEKLGVYERRPATTNTSPSQAAETSREQQLEQEVAELRSAVKVAEVDLTSAKSHVQQFKEISQANEVALSDLNSTFDEYKSSTENQIARHEAEYKALQEKLEASNNDLVQLRQQFDAAQKAFEEERTALKNDKKTLEDTIVDISTSEKRLESDRTSREEEVRTLEERAKASEDRYSHEVVAHAGSIKQVEQLRQDLAAAQVKVRENQAASENAIAKLAASEKSWNQQKQTLEKEISDLNGRCHDLSSQNALLHQHLESVSSQAARIRQAADSSSSPLENDVSDDADTKLSELRSVVTYLRKEKEIVDLQLELSKQENTRLKTQIEHLSQSLQEARTTLSEERERAVESAASASQHAELIERINQLNILRESNAMLRADCENHAKKARELETKLTQLSSELDPAKEQARVAQAELEAARGQLQRLEQESHGWQERNKQLLSKYDRVDPAEVQALKAEVERMKPELDEIKHAKAKLDEEMVGKQVALDEQTRRVEVLERNYRGYKEQAVKRITEMNNQRTVLAEDKKQLEAKLSALEAAGPTQTVAPDPALAEELKKQETLVASLQEERDKLMAEKEAWIKTDTVKPSTSETPATWEAEKAELVKARDEAVESAKMAQQVAQKATVDARNFKMQNDKFQSRLADAAKARAGEQERTKAAITEAVDKAKSALQSTSSDELVQRHAAALTALRTELRAKHESEIKALKETLASQTAAGEQQTAIDAALAEQKRALQEAHNKEIEAARESGRMEAAMKIKLKDSQLTKSAKRVKDLEGQIREWEASGKLPANSLGGIGQNPTLSSVPTASTSSVTAGTKPTVPTAVGTRPAAPVAGAKPSPQAAPAVAGPSGPVRKPVPAGTAARAPVRGRGQPSRPLPTKPATTPGGISIAGAAAAAAASTAGPKRPREDADTTGSDDSLAKRLKSAEPAASTAPAIGAKPVQLRRPPPGP